MTEEDYGPLLRPYMLTRGRTRPNGPEFDMTSIVRTSRSAREHVAGLAPEHLRILHLCRRPAAVADLASELGLSLNVLRILLGDLRDRGLITVRPQVNVAQLPAEPLLREVLEALRAL